MQACDLNPTKWKITKRNLGTYAAINILKKPRTYVFMYVCMYVCMYTRFVELIDYKSSSDLDIYAHVEVQQSLGIADVCMISTKQVFLYICVCMYVIGFLRYR